jgi:hypothetical protein
MTTLGEYRELFARYRGFPIPPEAVETDSDGITRIRMEGFADVRIGPDGGISMPRVISYPEGEGYAPAEELGWLRRRGAGAIMACIFADFYARPRRRGEKAPYLLVSPEEYLRTSRRTG